MLNFLARRTLQALLVLLTISLVSFIVQGELGDPTQQLVGQAVTPAERETLRQELGLEDAFVIQYGRFLKQVVQGDFGVSYYYKEPTLNVILDRLPATFELALCAFLLVLLISIPSGMFAAIHPKHVISRMLLFISTLGLSVPIFIVAIFLVYFVSVEAQWLPSFGRGDTDLLLGFWPSGLTNRDGLAHLVLPSVSLAFVLTPIFLRLVRAEMLDVLESDYVRFAWSKGLSAPRIYFVHALKNTMLPVITVGGIQAGTLVAYTIITETVFQWPGMGHMFMDAVTRVDAPLISSYLMVVGGMFVVINTVVDLIYGLVNPRVRIAGNVF